MTQPEAIKRSEEMKLIEKMPSKQSTENMDTGPETSGEEFLKEFRSIVKKKLEKPIDLKKLYHEQVENLL